MIREDYLGEFEQIVLLAVLRLGREAYGMTIRREIEQRAGRPTSIGAVYATLERLEAKGYVTSVRGEPTPERGGRAKRYYQVELSGVQALQRSREALERMWQGLEPVPEPG
jgi:DNA-binding PadR family transcriptional regulator